MNILFIYSLQDFQTPRKPLRTEEGIQFGISYISSFLKKHGHKTKLLFLSRIMSQRIAERAVDDCLKSFRPELICFTAVYSEYGFMKKIAQYVKIRYPHIYLIIGGCHVSLNPQTILSDDFDALCIGEGEYPTLELVSQLENNRHPSGIPNLWIKDQNNIEKNPVRPFLQDIDSLPFPDREMWKEWIEEMPGSRIPILLGRGCPFECTYCCNHALKRITAGRYVRLRSHKSILEEIKDIVTRYPNKKGLYLEVESFGINMEWAIGLCSLLEYFNKTLTEPLSFGVNLRVTSNADLEKLFLACKNANFEFINIGLESGSERVRREVLKRNYSNRDIINAVNLARKYCLEVNFFNLIGIPGETVRDFQETVRMNRICQPAKINPSIFFPYLGTELYSLCKEKKLIKEDVHIEMERRKATLDLPDFSRRQIQKSYFWFDFYVYKGYKPLHKLLLRYAVVKFSSNPSLKYVYRKLTNFFSLRRIKVGYIKKSLQQKSENIVELTN